LVETATGRLLDSRYQLGPVLGRGGMATVYAATDTKLRRSVAVKLFRPGVDENTSARLETEARLLGGLSHPGLLKVYDVCIAADESYLVLQLIKGCTLRKLVNEGPMRPVVVARLGARLAETLQYVHSRPIVHRDLKPSNVLLDEDGTGYLADFGIATLIGSARLTRTGHCVGTAAYLAPEQVCDVAPGPPVDIYSLALVLLECLTGRPEYSGTEVEAAVARLHRQPRVPDWLPPGLRDVLVAMTARVPADRPDAARCVELFEEYLARPNRAADAPTQVNTMPVPETPTRPRPAAPVRRWHPAQVAAAGALLAGIATATLFATSSGAGQPTKPAEPGGQTPVPVVAVVPATAAGQVVVDTPPAAVEQPPPAAQRWPQNNPEKARSKGGNNNGGGGGEG
jgi:serine/threonine protein kinase